MKKNVVELIKNEIKNAVDNYSMSEKVSGTLYDFISDREYEIVDTVDTDTLYEIFCDWNSTQEVIYYYNAWNVIKEYVESNNDYDFSGIRTALADFGYESIDDLGSELIATILTQYENDNAMSELISLIEDTTIYDDDTDDVEE